MSSNLLRSNGHYGGTNGCLNGMRHYGDIPMDDMEYTYAEKTSRWADFCKAGHEVFLDMADAVPGFVDSIGQECYDKMLQSFIDNKPTFYTSYWRGEDITRRDAHMGIMVPRWVGEAMDMAVYDVYQQVLSVGVRPYMAMLLSYILSGRGLTIATPTSWGDQSPFNGTDDYKNFRRCVKRLAAYTEVSTDLLVNGVAYLNAPMRDISGAPRNWVDLTKCKPFAFTWLKEATVMAGDAQGTLEEVPETLALVKKWNNQLQKAMLSLHKDYKPVLV